MDELVQAEIISQELEVQQEQPRVNVKWICTTILCQVVLVFRLEDLV